jgi:YhcH/YjgK/YiaL family protein
MIVDVLENADRYLALGRWFKEGFSFLMRSDLKELSPGRHDIYYDRVYAIVENTIGRKRENAQLEAHEKHIDIQLVVSGTDTMGWKLKSTCQKVSRKYDPGDDLQFFADEPDVWLPVSAGTFVIFHPEDAHMPLISPDKLQKVVIKIAVDQ